MKVGGIQIILDYSWFIVFGLVLWSLSAGYFPQAYPGQTTQIYWATGFLAALLFFVSVITHELSHSFMAIRSIEEDVTREHRAPFGHARGSHDRHDHSNRTAPVFRN